jgi:hypothetical protein
VRALAAHLAHGNDLNEAQVPALSQNPLLDPAAKGQWPDETAALARATRPTFGRVSTASESPPLWTAAQWTALRTRQAERPLFDMDAIRSQLDLVQWELDGVLILRGVMTDDTRQRWADACREVQEINDDLISQHKRWRTEIDWAALSAIRPPTRTITAEEAQVAMGQSTALSHGWPRTTADSEASGVRTLRMHSVLPEFFPPGHSSFLMEVLCHPQQLVSQVQNRNTKRPFLTVSFHYLTCSTDDVVVV